MRPLALALALVLPRAAFAAFIPSPLDAPRQAFQAGKYQEVITRLSPEAMQRLGNLDLARAYLILGEAYERTGRPDLALGVYELSTKIFPKNLELLTQLGLLLHHAGLEEQAQPVFEKVLSIHPHNAQAHMGLAEIDAALGLLDESAIHYEKALETLGGMPDLWRDYAEVLYRHRDYSTAETAARKSLDIAQDADTFVDLAFIQRGQGKLGDALTTLDDAVRRAPARSDLALLRSAWLLEAGRFDEALPAAQAVLTHDPQEPLALWIRARVSFSRGRLKEAADDLRAAAAAERRAPFVASAAQALLRRLPASR